jgi:putative Ca2+/H+ antiporter (TMEM165/GDT1 family)
MEAFAVSALSTAVGELGDKTQLLSLVLATRLRRPVPIIAGILVATLANHLLACAAGQWAGEAISARTLRWVVGACFLGVAAWALVPDRLDESASPRGAHGIFWLVVATFFLAEMGDKTQIAAIALAAKYRQLPAVVAGTTLGMMAVNVPTVLLARTTAKWISLRAIRVLSALIYAALGVATLLGVPG